MAPKALLRRRAELAETAFFDLADILSSAPDPTPLLSDAGSLKAAIHGMTHVKAWQGPTYCNVQQAMQ